MFSGWDESAYAKRSFIYTLVLHGIALSGFLLSFSWVLPKYTRPKTSQIMQVVAVEAKSLKTLHKTTYSSSIASEPKVKKTGRVEQKVIVRQSKEKPLTLVKKTFSHKKALVLKKVIHPKQTTKKASHHSVVKHPVSTSTKTHTQKHKRQRASSRHHLSAKKGDEKKSSVSGLKQSRGLKKTHESLSKLSLLKTTTANLLAEQLNAESEALANFHRDVQATEIERYIVQIKNTIGQHWILPANVNKRLSADLLIRLAPGGMVLGVEVFKSSGNSALDHSAIHAVWKASPLPVPRDTNLFKSFRQFHLVVRPEGVLS
jgi:colicin import membrane protein